MKYFVKIDYKVFEFADRYDALNFAEMAAEASDMTVNVSIEIRKEAVEHE